MVSSSSRVKKNSNQKKKKKSSSHVKKEFISDELKRIMRAFSWLAPKIKGAMWEKKQTNEEKKKKCEIASDLGRRAATYRMNVCIKRVEHLIKPTQSIVLNSHTLLRCRRVLLFFCNVVVLLSVERVGRNEKICAGKRNCF